MHFMQKYAFSYFIFFYNFINIFVSYVFIFEKHIFTISKIKIKGSIKKTASSIMFRWCRSEFFGPPSVPFHHRIIIKKQCFFFCILIMPFWIRDSIQLHIRWLTFRVQFDLAPFCRHCSSPLITITIICINSCCSIV